MKGKHQMIINKETIEQNTLRFIETLFSLPEIEKVAIKDVIIISPDDYNNIKKGLELCYHDVLSDVDFNVWLRLSPEDFHGDTPVYKNYFPRLGFKNEIFGVLFVEHTDDETCKEGMRICLKSGFRMDFTCFTRCDENSPSLPKLDLRTKTKIHQPQNIWPDLDLDKANSFWFITIQALAKLLRRDYLISDHLSYVMLMECLVLQMEGRDNLYKTNFHRYGYAEQIAYNKINISNCEKYMTDQDDTYNYIARNLCKAAICYDNLAAASNAFYQKRSNIFFDIWDCYLDSLKYSW